MKLKLKSSERKSGGSMRFASMLALLLSIPLSTALTNDTIPVQFVYRNDTQNERRVVFQGEKGANFENFCGEKAKKCICVFSQNANDRNLLRAPVIFSAEQNAIRCSIPGTIDPDLYKYARLEARSFRKASAKLEIRTSLQLTDVIGDLPREKVRGIYRYSCNRTFFEGEGVSQTRVACPARQRLGLIFAKYSYYLFNSSEHGNMQKKGTNSAFDSPVCEREFTQFSCDGAPDLRWGLFGEKREKFNVAVTMTPNPRQDPQSEIYGFAAMTDRNGDCPVGLVKIRPWNAQPSSIIEGSIDGGIL